MRYHRTTGLTDEQLDELTERVARGLGEPWDKPVGRHRAVRLHRAVQIAVIGLRHNIIQEVLAEFTGVSQATISRITTAITPLIRVATAEFVPTTAQATEAVAGAVALVDGTLAPCWSWRGHRELWAGKHSTTGHNLLIVTGLAGNIIYVSEPMTGNAHDMTVLTHTDVTGILTHAGGVIADKGFQGSGYLTPIKKPLDRDLYSREHDHNNQVSALRAPVERAIANLKTWRILHTDYRRPLPTWYDSFKAATGLYFFAIT